MALDFDSWEKILKKNSSQSPGWDKRYQLMEGKEWKGKRHRKLRNPESTGNTAQGSGHTERETTQKRIRANLRQVTSLNWITCTARWALTVPRLTLKPICREDRNQICYQVYALATLPIPREHKTERKEHQKPTVRNRKGRERRTRKNKRNRPAMQGRQVDKGKRNLSSAG